MRKKLVTSAIALAMSVCWQQWIRPASAADASSLRVTLVSTPEAIATRSEAPGTSAEPAGFRAVLLRDAGRACNAEVSFATAPWPRALEMVRAGTASGAFAASFSAERAAFAAYPMRDGAADPEKAMREQVYNLYVNSESAAGGRESSGFSARDGKIHPAGSRAIVERSSIGVAIARAAGAEPVEVGGYPSMVRMLAERREPTLIGVDQHIQAVLRREQGLASRMARLEPPLARQHGYVIFALAFHDRNKAFAECFWSAIARIRATDRYRDLVRAQNDGDFIE